MFALHLLMGKFNGDIINAVQELLSSSSTVIETSRMMATMIVLISIISNGGQRPHVLYVKKIRYP